MKLYSYCNIVGLTDVGCKRPVNEDWLDHFESKNGLVAVVCDGMGGHVGGEVASHIAVDTIRQFLQENYFDDPRQAIIEACNVANEAILRRTQERPELTGMGATCVMLIIRDGKVYYGSVGDSRIYLVRSKHITQLTKDQSYVQMLVDAGEITREQMEHHPRKNEITNALGLPSMTPAVVCDTPVSPEAGDCFILCSDGLSGMVPDSDILKIASDQARMNQKSRVEALISLAKKNGGLDNITCEIVEFSLNPNEVPITEDKKVKVATTRDDSAGNGKRKFILIAAIALIVIVVALILLFCMSGKNDETKSKEGDSTEQSEPAPAAINTDCTDVIVYAPEKEALLFEVNKNYKSIEFGALNENATRNIIREPISLSDIQIYPGDKIKILITEDNMTVSFNSEPFTANELKVAYTYNDTTYTYKFPVKVDEQKTEFKTPTPRAEPTAKPVSTPGVNFEVPSSEILEEVSGEELAEPVLDVKVKLAGGKKTTDITVHASNGQNTDSNIYTNIYPIQQIDAKTEWYTAKCTDQRECKITVNNSKVPAKNATIKIPLITHDKNLKKELIIRIIRPGKNKK